MGLEVDWQHGAKHMWNTHQVTVEQANEALGDDERIVAGVSARVIGYSPAATAVLVVILARREGRPGAWWGANGWRANSTEGRTYWEQSEQKAPAMSNAKQLVEQIAAEADATAGKPMPAGTVWTKPGKTVTVATRVSPEHLAAFEDLAGQLDVPMSALLRGWILAGLNAREDETVQTAIERLAYASSSPES